MKLPIKVPTPDNRGDVLTLSTEQEVLDYQHQTYAKGLKVTNQVGAPQPNFSVGFSEGLTLEECRKLISTSRLF